MTEHPTLKPGYDKQRHRFRRYLMTVLSSLVVLLLVFVLDYQGQIEKPGFTYSASMTLFLFALFAILFRSRINLKSADPSLTAPMMVSSILMLTLTMYYSSSDARGLLLLIFLVTFLFGILRLQIRELFFIGLFASLCYGLIIAALLQTRPATINLTLEFTRWGTMSAVLTWFAMIGGYISRVRKKLSDNNIELGNALQTIQELATHDALTGLHNRRYLEQALRHEKSQSDRSAKPFCLCLVDLDLFKAINDSLGHHSGDAVLAGFSANAMQGMRQADHFGRYGGEEFLAILTNTEIAGALTWAENLRQKTAALDFPGLAQDVHLTISIGIAQYCPGESIEKTISRADKGLYCAKTSGRNRAVALEVENPAAQVAVGATAPPVVAPTNENTGR